MADPVQFYVDDTSPSISYFPFGDTFSLPNLTAGWNPYFDQTGFASTSGGTGNGTSYHVTSRDGASLSVQWKGTGIQLFGKVNQAAYSITLDGTPAQSITADLANDVLADFNNLTDNIHTIVLTTQMPAIQSQPQFFFDKVLIIASHDPIPNVTQRALNDSNIAYSGQWSFRDNTGSSFHHSDTAGDHAETQFQGISFLLNGTTSPTSGRYTVILDDVATTLSAKSSFTQRESLLFYASSLDPNVTHTLKVVNEDGGDLSLNVGGFGVFSSDSAISVTPSPTPSSSASVSSTLHRNGTIAALVLGGVLFFVILTGAIFFVFVHRPRRRRRRLLGVEQNRKEAEAGIVIDIGPEPRPDAELRGTETMPPQRSSERSGFARWKREMEGGLGSLIGISFRHSGSSRGRNASRRAVDNHLWSPKSSLFSTSSKASSERSKRKGKKKNMRQHLGEGPWSPNVAIELPVRPSSPDSTKDKDIDPSQDIPEGPHSVISTLTSLSYVSAPSAHQNTHPAPPPPSYSASNSNRNSHSTGPHSVPHSAAHSLASATHHNGRDSQGLSQTYSDPNPGSPDDDLHHRYDPTVPASQLPDTNNPPSRPVGGGRDGAHNSEDDAASYLGPAFTQFALRGLSPRTSEYIQPKPVEPSKPVGEKPLDVHRVKPRPLPEPPEPRADQFDSHRARDSSWDIPPELVEERARETVSKPIDNPFLNVVATSPFRVDFPSARSLRQNRDSGPPASFVRFDEESKEEPITTGDRESSKQGGENSQDARAKRRSVFRLTPPSGSSRTRSFRRPRADSTSFLDFSSSSDSSTRTQSLITSDDQEGGRQWGNLPLHRRLQARWSNTGTELSRNASIGAPRSVFSGNFPYPVSLPTSPHHPEGHVPPEGMTISTQQLQHMHDTSDSPPVGTHPTSLGIYPVSPVDSVPVSVSEIHFRRHSAESHSTSSPIPPHPPLPGRDTGTEVEHSVAPPLSTPNLIVQRVLGQTPTPSPSTQHHNT